MNPYIRPMQPISVVIVCKNESEIIGKTLGSVKELTDDIVVYDNGSTDGTQEVVKKNGVKLFEGTWEGFGKTKRKAVELARYDWILSIDADEQVDDTLKKSLSNLSLNNPSIAYEIKFKNFFNNRHLKFGEWGGDSHLRLFNRSKVNWDEALVHEKLIIPADVKISTLDGHILHQTVKDIGEFAGKTVHYALLNAEKYHFQGKRSSWIKIYLGPFFAFFQYYFLKLGFLDGWEGFVCARMTAYYTFLKYGKLKELNRGKI